ncbi:porin [Flavihumibacter petaseus]|uniref:Phosphate-selective porin O and P n=1 Tax=Flavihumibacter petaseus NBRC 106054 TaxID=1220578 RepID=A0A0E9N317_9BACT|nr:porin [Flavihumibacter petaseus]GAO44061.1 hypothetical protein FPE01S_03_01010 [Flavihumibacter petaseus NBRC 106054]
MRLVCFIGILILLHLQGHSQQDKQTDTLFKNDPLIKVRKAELLNNVDVIFNVQAGLNNNFRNGEYVNSQFAINQFRFEIKGKVYKDKIFFRFRDRYTRDPEVQSVDNVSRSTDLAFIGYNISQKTSVTIGKMTANWGGFEFDMNPIDIYQYNDIINNSDNFLTGVQFSWTPSTKNAYTAQVLNSRTKTYREIYGFVPGVTEAKFPAAYIGNWSGNFADGRFKTIYSFSIFQEATENGKPVNMYYTALGNQLTISKWRFQYDFKWSAQDLDRTGIISDLVKDSLFSYAAKNVGYFEHWLRVTYLLRPQLKLSIIGMVSTGYWYDIPDPSVTSSKLRTSWGVIPTVEYYPIKNFNLKFYATYVGQYIKFTDYAKTALGQVNYNTSRVMLGITSPLTVL